jgi:predicted Zn-dependent peptidase
METRAYESIGETLTTAVLPNGLGLSVVRKPGYAKSCALFATNYGGADRRFLLAGEWKDTPAGVAHFLEHKMFDMPDGGNALNVLSANGASPNAFTSQAMTAYHFESTSGFKENLRTLLHFVSVPWFTPESVAKEQGIIGQEIRMTEDSPDFAVYMGLMKSLYAVNPLRDSVAGTVESISHITAQTLYDCHKVFYNPSNMALCVVGDVDPARILPWQERNCLWRRARFRAETTARRRAPFPRRRGGRP